ncbi:acyl-CoA N-acyltransferase [Mycena belliarum]|uniref:Acyl-CoA N-acyltransferase n=1 Tax=Mycena belliarum TaxID=1033014 RepID=A0AAD6U9G7_9AGAR|nr:acyl-CoA N-acyltransferase [Mycena belliae]
MPTVRVAEATDAPTLVSLVRRAYQGERGWTTAAALLNDERMNEAQMLKKIEDPETTVHVAMDGSRIVGCCELVRLENGKVHFGTFAVEPELQAAGVGRYILTQTEIAAAKMGVTCVEMTVIAQRPELIAWYQRRGYALTGETRPFPFHTLINGGALRDDLYFVVLEKPVSMGV